VTFAANFSDNDRHGSSGQHEADGSNTQSNAALMAASPRQSPYDPPGAPCVNCDENGRYRAPGRENCTVSQAEREMVQGTVDRLAEDPYDYERVHNVMTFAMMALVCTDYLYENGGFDVIFAVLRNADHMPDRFSPAQRGWFEMDGWMALSDQSMSVKGAPIIANYGGPNKGIEFMVERLQAHHTPHELVFDSENSLRQPQLTIRYEITCNIQGILANDQNQEWADAAVKAGLMEELLYTMQVERDFSCSPMWASCSALTSLLAPKRQRYESYKAKLVNLGAVEITRQALEACTPFHPHGDQPFMAGMSWGQLHPADQTCGAALALLTS